MFIGYTDQEINRMTFTKWIEYVQLIKNIRLRLYNVFIHMIARYKKQAFNIWKHYGKIYCMYVCMYACMHVYIYIYIHTICVYYHMLFYLCI